MDGLLALELALGHVRNATAAWLAVDDPSGESLFLAADCLALEGLFADLGVVPVVVDEGLDAARSLVRAAELVASARAVVPLAVWATVSSLRSRALR